MVSIMNTIRFLFYVVFMATTVMVSNAANILCVDDSTYCDAIGCADPAAYGYRCDDGNSYCYCN